ncbi:MAG: hypothetical protein WCF90_00020 [Methanomicrobiales archaeon]
MFHAPGRGFWQEGKHCGIGHGFRIDENRNKVVNVPVAVPVKKELLAPDEKRAGAVCGIEDAKFRHIAGVLSFTSSPTVCLTMYVLRE